MDQSIIFLFAAIVIVGGLMIAAIGLTKKGTKYLNVEYYRVKWLEIEQQLKRDEPSTFHIVVLNADKLLGHALEQRGFKGQTMGERMKNANKTFSNNSAVWSAHKLRNQIAHEPDVRVTYDSARAALGSFRQALKDLGAI